MLIFMILCEYLILVLPLPYNTMMQTQRQLLRLSSASFLFPSLPPPPFPHHLYFPCRPNNQYSLCTAHRAWVAQLSEQLTAADSPVQGLIHLPPSISSLLSSNDNPDALQTAASFLITAAFSLFLFQTLRRSANRAKQKVRLYFFLYIYIYMIENNISFFIYLSYN